MNELFAADPKVFENSSELKFMLSKFGPETGQYLAAYPRGWSRLVEDHLFPKASPVAAEKVKTLLRRARENLCLIDDELLPYKLHFDEKISWLNNARCHVECQPQVFSQLVSSQKNTIEAVVTLDEFKPPSNAGEFIKTTPDEYCRVCGIICFRSHELFLVDPYADPCNKYIRSVLLKLLQLIGHKKGKCRKVMIFARHSIVLGSDFKKKKIQNALNDIRRESFLPLNCALSLTLYDDEKDLAVNKMHGRYLFSKFGGISLDQGFRDLPLGREMHVSPLSNKIVDELIKRFQKEEHDMVKTVTFIA